MSCRLLTSIWQRSEVTHQRRVGTAILCPNASLLSLTASSTGIGDLSQLYTNKISSKRAKSFAEDGGPKKKRKVNQDTSHYMPSTRPESSGIGLADPLVATKGRKRGGKGSCTNCGKAGHYKARCPQTTRMSSLRRNDSC